MDTRRSTLWVGMSGKVGMIVGWVWRSLAARVLWEHGAAGSNPVTRTRKAAAANGHAVHGGPICREQLRRHWPCRQRCESADLRVYTSGDHRRAG